MNLLIIRHAIAMDREEFASTDQSDDLRPLTPKGAARMEKIAKGLRTQVEEIGRLGTSPLTRAVQTADIVAEAYGISEPEVTSSLIPGTPFEEFEKWAASDESVDVIAVVGHEPHLSSLSTWLLKGGSEPAIELKKGGACLIEFESGVRKGSGTMRWLLAPRQLRKLAA